MERIASDTPPRESPPEFEAEPSAEKNRTTELTHPIQVLP
jgi:hypothetical protein